MMLLAQGALISNFSSVDWLIVAAYLLGTLVVGLFVNRYIKNMGDFLVAGRSLKTNIGIATMIGSELGLVTAMYSAQKGFTGGFAAFHIGLLAGIACLLVGFSGFIVVPLRKMGVMTIPEFYEKRFKSRSIRIFGGFLLAGSGILNMGLFLKAGAIFVTGLTGMTDPNAINLVMTTMILLVLVYTTLGGMVSVVITDYVQFVVLSIGLLLSCVLAVNLLGWENIVTTMSSERGIAGFDPFDGAEFGGSYVAWMFFMGVISCAVWQTSVMRACAAESVQVVRRLYIWSSLGFVVRNMIPQFLGICALVYFANNAELRAAFIDLSPDDAANASLSAAPVFLSQLLPVGVIGLVGAGMLAAFMSTHDTYLLCWASVLTQDVIDPATDHRLSDRTRILVTRILLFVIAAFLLIWSMWYPLGQDMWDYMAISGAIYFTGAFVVLTAGIYSKRASRAGAWLALLAGLGAVAGLGVVQDGLHLPQLVKSLGPSFTFLLNDKELVRSHYIGLDAIAAAVIVMIVASLLLPDREDTTHTAA